METNPPAEPGDEELVGRAKTGDREAFGVLVERYKHKAYRIAYHFTRDREDAKDISQEAFLRAFAHVDNFDLRSAFYTWFYRILVNLCLDHRRKRRFVWSFSQDRAGASGAHVESHETAGPSFSPDQEAAAREICRKVEGALDRLPAKQRAVFLLKNHEGLSIREIAAIMRTAEGTVKVHLHRAVVALRRCLEEPV